MAKRKAVGSPTEVINVVVDPELKARCEENAKKHGFATSQWVRRVILLYLEAIERDGDPLDGNPFRGSR